jgi:hypothetical protein
MRTQATIYTWCSGSGRIELQLTLDQARSASHQGRCDDDVLTLSRDIASQISTIDPADLTRELREYGAWDDTELADHNQNLQRILWLAAGDIVENPQDYITD